MSKTLIALGGSIESLPILRRVKELGHRLIVVDGNPAAPGLELADEYMLLSCYGNHNHPDGIEWDIVSAISNCLKGSGWVFPDGIICAAVDSPLLAAKLAAKYHWPGLSAEAAGLGADKYKQAEALHGAGIPTPDFVIVDELTHGANVRLLDLTELLWDGAVIKPLDSRGARGVIRLLPDVDPAWAYEQARAQSPTGRVMVEEWLDGQQLSTESLVQDGKVLFTAVGLRNYSRLEEFAPYVVEDGFDEPFTGDAGTIGMGVNDLIEYSCRALNWYQTGGGVVKGDLVIHKGKLHVIELAPRLSGGLFCAAHELTYGVDFIGAAINMALGYTIEAPKSYTRQFVSQRYIFPSASDIGKRIVSLYRGDPGAVFSHYSKSIGHVIQPVTAHPDRLGQALCVGATPQEARELAERAVEEMYSGMVIK